MITLSSDWLINQIAKTGARLMKTSADIPQLHQKLYKAAEHI